MNFLAHLFLSDHCPHLIVGNFLADFLQNKEVADLPLPVREGVRMHREIDSFTDVHPAVRNAVRRLRPVHGKFAPVVLDVCFDYVLVKNWGRYASEGIHHFTKYAYGVLEDHAILLPPYLRERLPKMIADDWLVKYGTEPGLRFTFERLQLRTKYPQYFHGAVDNFFAHYNDIENDFNQFFPDLILAMRHWIQKDIEMV